ncbi:MAG TPA: hypothetical protein VFP32_01625 [Candidatus Saccharimonadales bacterium]|nr:hypothetical protein [Candidatus Saccharimonadales bacterium]
MSLPPDRERSNYSALFTIGAAAESRVLNPKEAQREMAQTALESLVRKQAIESPYLAIRGLTRYIAITLFNELDTNLNPLTHHPGGLLGLARMDETGLASIVRDPILIRTDSEADVDISLEESEPGAGRFDLEVRRGPGLEEDPLTFSKNLHSAFDVIMRQIDLRRASSYSQQLIEGRTENDTAIMPLRRLMAKNRLAVIPQIEARRRKEPEQYYEDLLEIKLLATVLGIEELDEVDNRELVDFWRSRDRSQADVIKLFFYITDRKKQVSAAENPFHRYTADNLIRYGIKKSESVKLTKEVEDGAKDVLTRVIRINPQKATQFFGPKESELNKLKMLYIAWLARYGELVDVRRGAIKVFGTKFETNHDRISAMQDVYKVAINNIEEEANRHKKINSSDSWGTFGVVDYDLSIPEELDEYNKKLNFYRTAWLLGKYLFTSEKIDEAMHQAEKVF